MAWNFLPMATFFLQTLRWPRAVAKRLTRPWHRHKVYLSNESGRSSGILEKGEVHGGWIRPGRPEWHVVGVECVWSSIFASTGIFGTDARKRSQLAVTQCARLSPASGSTARGARVTVISV